MILISRFLASLILVSALTTYATTINGRILILSTTGTKYSVMLQINTNTGINKLGGATIVLNFDTTAISFPNNPVRDIDYIFHNFSGGNYYPATVTKPQRNRVWVNIDLPFYYNNQGTIVAGSPEWTNLVTINFNIVNANRTPELSWYLSSPFWGIYDSDNITQWTNGIFNGNFGLAVDIIDGWNLVSVPGINPNGQGVNNWWQFRDRNANVYKLQNGYVSVTTTKPGEGYFMKHIGNRTYNTGDEWPAAGIQIVPHTPINAVAGWNLIGGYENTVLVANLTTTPPGLISRPVFTFAGTFKISNQIEPGKGYLVFLEEPGQINIPGLMVDGKEKVVEYFRSNWGKLTFTDYSGKDFSLYLVDDDTDLSFYMLPPVPPEGMFDIRFRSGRMIEQLNSGIHTVLMKDLEYPVKVRVENMNINLKDDSGQKINTDLHNGAEFTIHSYTINKLLIQAGRLVTPNNFYLGQNYPNPFNPSTTIKYSVPVESNVNISLYNVLGELIKTLVDKDLKPGNYEYKLNASDLSSGVYLYRLVAGEYTETRKMILLR